MGGGRLRARVAAIGEWAGPSAALSRCLKLPRLFWPICERSWGAGLKGLSVKVFRAPPRGSMRSFVEARPLPESGVVSSLQLKNDQNRIRRRQTAGAAVRACGPRPARWTTTTATSSSVGCAARCEHIGLLQLACASCQRPCRRRSRWTMRVGEDREQAVRRFVHEKKHTEAAALIDAAHGARPLSTRIHAFFAPFLPQKRETVYSFAPSGYAARHLRLYAVRQAWPHGRGMWCGIAFRDPSFGQGGSS